MRRSESGYIVVETIGSFTLLVLLMALILSLINIVVVQARVHYAITQAAETISMYSYVLEVTGTEDHLINLDREASGVRIEADEFKTNINGIINGINTLSPGEIGKNGEAAVNKVYGWAEDTVDDPKETIRLMLDYGLSEGSNAIFEKLLRPLVGRYLGNGSLSGDQYLRSFNVTDGLDGLDFYDFSLTDLNSIGQKGSTLIDSNGDVRVTVHYSVDLAFFGALHLPVEARKLNITQTVVTKAWLNGKGEGYTVDD